MAPASNRRSARQTPSSRDSILDSESLLRARASECIWFRRRDTSSWRGSTSRTRPACDPEMALAPRLKSPLSSCRRASTAAPATSASAPGSSSEEADRRPASRLTADPDLNARLSRRRVRLYRQLRASVELRASAAVVCSLHQKQRRRSKTAIPLQRGDETHREASCALSATPAERRSDKT